MKEEKTTRLRFTYAKMTYRLRIDSTKFSDTLIVNKLRVGKTRYWLIFQNESWRFIGEMPLCKELKLVLVRKIAGLQQLPYDYSLISDKQETFRTGIIFNALLSALALKKQLN